MIVSMDHEGRLNLRVQEPEFAVHYESAVYFVVDLMVVVLEKRIVADDEPLPALRYSQ